MKYIIASAVLLVVLAVFLATTDAAAAAKPFSCYTCDNCGDPFILNGTALAPSQKCAEGIKTCYKFHHSDKKIQRGCSPNKDDECPEDKGEKIRLTYCYTCYHGDCNSGRRLTDMPTLTISTAAVTAVLGSLMWKKF